MTSKSTELLNELLKKQLKKVPSDKKLCYRDMKRICQYIKTSIFDENVCSIWSGYVTNVNNATKGVYINLYFRGKKTALHRLLYCNFVDSLDDDEYLKFICENKGKCCNIMHLKKFKYIKKKESVEVVENADNENKNEKIGKKTEKRRSLSFVISFD